MCENQVAERHKKISRRIEFDDQIFITIFVGQMNLNLELTTNRYWIFE